MDSAKSVSQESQFCNSTPSFANILGAGKKAISQDYPLVGSKPAWDKLLYYKIS